MKITRTFKDNLNFIKIFVYWDKVLSEITFIFEQFSPLFFQALLTQRPNALDKEQIHCKFQSIQNEKIHFFNSIFNKVFEIITHNQMKIKSKNQISNS